MYILWILSNHPLVKHLLTNLGVFTNTLDHVIAHYERRQSFSFNPFRDAFPSRVLHAVARKKKEATLPANQVLQPLVKHLFTNLGMISTHA